MTIFAKAYRILLQVLCIPVFLSEFFEKQTGAAYGLGFGAKWKLLWTMIRNNRKIVSGSTFMEHITMATSLLKTPPTLEGIVVECGTYKGVSAANLSLVCALVGRRLAIFDCFEGLPEPTAKDQAHTLIGHREIHTYTRGSWCGTLDEVRENIRRYGKLEVCDFHKGYFDKTLPGFNEKCVQIFLDVDYLSSLETCLTYLWPLLQDGCPLYTHESGHLEIAALFFSESWWHNHFASSPPGLVGAGTGLGFKILTGSYFNSNFGFTIKNPARERFTTVPQAEGGMKLSLGSSIKIASQGGQTGAGGRK